MLKSKKDYKIMQNIIENARIPLTILAKRTGMSREVVQYRLKRLEENLIINYQARINLRFFADAIYTIYLNMKGVERTKTISKLRSLPLVHWIGNSGGRWNYVLTFSVTKENDLENFVNKLFSSFGNKITHWTFTQHIKEFKDTFGSLFGVKEFRISEKNIEKKYLDKMDIRILRELTKNARLSNLQIAIKIGTTRETVRKRIKRLEKEDVILNYRTMIRPSALDLENYALAIKCMTTNTKELEKICDYFSRVEGCSYGCITAGEINMLVTLSVKNLKELDFIITKAQKDFILIREIEPLPLFEIGSQNYVF